MCAVWSYQAVDFVHLHAEYCAGPDEDKKLISIHRPLHDNSLKGVPEWAQDFINEFWIEQDLATLVHIGRELQIEM